MEFSSARAIEQIVWQLRLSDYPRSLNRSKIDALANGSPPYDEVDAERNGKEINVNDLSLTRLSHDARLQLYQGFNKPGSFFTSRTDCGAVSKRQARGITVTKEINRFLKRSDDYYQCMLSKLGLNVLHGIGPSNWENQDSWCPIPLELSDVLMPSRTLLTFRNLPFFALWRGYTPNELLRLTRHANRNPGWNMPVVKQAIEWADEQTAKLYGGTTWAEYWVPEKAQERYKEDAGLYASDLVQTIDCWDFYYYDDANKHAGWRRKIIFDAEGGYRAWNGPSGYGEINRLPEKNLLGEKGLFLYDSKDRVLADKLSEIVHFQFADLSAVMPARYHSVRSLGFLLFAACHLQNRLRCAFSEAVFENLMMYIRVKSLDEAERALKIEFVNRGVIDDSVSFLRPEERWQPNYQFAELGLNEYKQIISDNSASYVQNQNLSRDRTEKTKFQVMAEVNAMQTLVSAALQQAYRYQTSEYREIFRRFMKRDSLDPDVKEFQARCLKQDVPEKLLVADAWDIEPERVVGGGNKTLEMAIAQQLMEWRAAYGPSAQQEILRIATLGITDDAAMTQVLVPQEPGVSDAKHDAMLAFGSLMAGAKMEWDEAFNRIETAQTLIAELALAVKRVLASGGMTNPDKLAGMQNVLQHVGQLVSEIHKDKPNEATAKQLADASGKLANQVKAFAQRLEQARKKAQQQNGDGKDAELKAKVAAVMVGAKVKAANARESHAQKTAQRQMQWESEQKQHEQEHAQSLRFKAQEAAVDVASKDLETAATIRRERNKPQKPEK